MNVAQAVRDEELRRPETEHLIDYSGVMKQMVHQDEEDRRSRKHRRANRTKHEGSRLLYLKRKAASCNPRTVAGTHRKTHK